MTQSLIQSKRVKKALKLAHQGSKNMSLSTTTPAGHCAGAGRQAKFMHLIEYYHLHGTILNFAIPTTLLTFSALLRLILSSADESSSACAVSCTELIWSKALKGRCNKWAGGHGDKVLAAMIRSGSSIVQSEAAEEIKPLIKEDLQKWAEELVTPHPKSQKVKKVPGSSGHTKGAPANVAEIKPAVGAHKVSMQAKLQTQRPAQGDLGAAEAKKAVGPKKQAKAQSREQPAKKTKRA